MTTEMPEDIPNRGDQLRLPEAADSGVYYVLLPDGRLRKIEYSTAPLKKAPEQKKEKKEAEKKEPQAAPRQPKIGKQESVEYSQRYSQMRRQAAGARAQPPISRVQVVQAVPARNAEASVRPEPITYVAHIQYTDVEPIRGPVYSYSAAPLVRIIRK